jgi:hypothetical protein
VYLEDLEEVFARYKSVLIEYSDCRVCVDNSNPSI